MSESEALQFWSTVGDIILVSLAIYWLGTASLCAWLAHEKGHDRLTWFVLGLLFNWLALLALVGAPAREWKRISVAPEPPQATPQPGDHSYRPL